MSEQDELAQFERLREARLQVHTALAELLPKLALETCAQRLGLWRNGAYALRNQTEMYILLDFALYSYRDHGISLQQQYLTQSGVNVTPEQKLYVEASMQSRFRLFTIDNVVPNLGVNVRDVLNRDTFFVKDQAFSHSFSMGTSLAGRIVEFPTFAITSGVAIPLPESALPLLLHKIERFFAKKPLQPLAESDNLKIQLLVLQLCLAASGAP
jgi:hypothetical protein